MASHSPSAMTEAPSKREAERGYQEHVASAAAGRNLAPEVQAQVVAGAHEASMAAAEAAAQTLRSGEVPSDTLGSGAAVGTAPSPQVSVQLPTAEQWDAALHPRAVEPAPPGLVTTAVHPHSKMGATRWPGEQAADDTGAK